jgi:hypothetical protein
VAFYDMEYDNPEWEHNTILLTCESVQKVPWIMAYKNGKVENSIGENLSEERLEKMLTTLFPVVQKV